MTVPHHVTRHPNVVATLMTSLTWLLRLLVYLSMVTVAANMPDMKDEQKSGMHYTSHVFNRYEYLYFTK